MNYRQLVQRQRDANLVSELFDNVMKMDTPERRGDYERAKEWFENKYPGADWIKWATEAGKGQG